MSEHLQESQKKKKTIKKALGKLGPLLALAILCLILSVLTKGKFHGLNNISNILTQVPIIALMAGGMLMVLLTGGIDLSAGSLLAVSTCFMGVMLKKWGISNPFILIVFGMAVGVFMGICNGLMLTKLKLPHPFISTLGMKNIARGLALVITGSAAIAGFPKAVVFLGFKYIKIGEFSLPVSFLLVIVVFTIIHIMLNSTRLGKKIYAYGGNREAARLAGISVDRILIFVYAASGFMCALAGQVYIGRLNSAVPLASLEGDLDAIAACIIGGTSFSGGKGNIVGTLIGAFMIAVIRNGSNLLGLSSDLQQIIIGAVIVVAVFVDVLRTRLSNKAKKMAIAMNN